MNGMGMGMPPNAMMNQQGMHPHMMGQQPTAPGLAGMMPPHSSTQAVSTHLSSERSMWRNAAPCLMNIWWFDTEPCMCAMLVPDSQLAASCTASFAVLQPSADYLGKQYVC